MSTAFHHDQRNEHPWRAGALAAALTGLLLSGALACDPAPEPSPGAIEIKESAVMCDGESRSAVTNLNNPMGAVGRLLVDNNPACSGTVIAPNKVITAAHCLDLLAPSRLKFQPQFGIITSGTGPVTANVTRVVQAEDFDGTQTATSDWAFLTLDRDLRDSLGNFQTMQRTWVTSTGGSMTLVGYHGDKFSNRPGRETCTLGAINDFAMHHNCDVIGGASGGPIFTSAGLIGLQSGHGNPAPTAPQCPGTRGNTAANGRSFSFAPDNAGGLAVSHRSDGLNRVWATDKDWTLVALRDRKGIADSAGWTLWDAFDSGFGGARKIGAVNLQDFRQTVFVVTSSNQLRLRWENSVGGSWSAWSTMSTPVGVKDVAVTGGSGVRTQLFVLGTDNTLYTTFKTGGASSAWSSWVNLGSKSSAKAIAAVRWNGMSVAFIASPAGIDHTWGNDGSFVPLVSLGNSASGFRAVSAGLLQDGRIHLQAVDSNNRYRTRTRLADGSAWTAWATFPAANPVNTTGFVTLATGRLPDLREHLLAVASTGEIYTISEDAGGGFSGSWKRFYR